MRPRAEILHYLGGSALKEVRVLHDIRYAR
jgi:hypothetical protein